MKQFIITTPIVNSATELSGEDYHYLVDVLRLEEGASFRGILPHGGGSGVLNGGGAVCGNDTPGGSGVPGERSASCEATISIVKISRKKRRCLVHIELSEKRPQAPRLATKIVLFQSMPKGAKLDLIIRQAAEFAVDEIVPFVSNRSINRNSTGSGAAGGNARLERLRRIVREARQQSGSPVDTKIHETLDFEGALNYRAFLERKAPLLSLCFSPQGERGVFTKLSEWAPPGGVIALFIGPEGGFSGEEEGRFASLGFKFLSLGATTLRCETAALAAISVVRAVLEKF